MIQWLVQSAEQNSDLARGIAPAGLLHPTERAQLSRLRLAKRRREWLLGRWTAKHLLQTCLTNESHRCLPLEAIVISNDACGVPGALSECAARVAQWALSISHSGHYAF